MKTSSPPRAATLLAMIVALAACSPATRQAGPSVVQPGAPGEAGRAVGAAQAADRAQAQHTEADVRFMQHMIAHHAQALVLSGLVAGRSTSGDIQSLARRIEMSQKDEIALMQRWLRERGEAVPSVDDHHAHHGAAGQHGHHGAAGDHALMPGMLSREELDRLAAARGAEFDRLFLEFMIRHHEGALVMVEELFASEGGAQETEIFQFAAHVDSDQRVEIARMSRMLGALPPGTRQR